MNNISIYRPALSSISQDSEITTFEREINAILKEAPGARLAIDLSMTFHVSSRALGLLVAFRKQISAKGGKLVVFSANPAVKKVLEVTRLTTLIPVLNDERAASALLERE